MVALLVGNALPLALPALYCPLSALTVTLVQTEFLDSITKEIKFATVCQATLLIPTETVFNLTAMLILTAQLATLFSLTLFAFDALLEPTGILHFLNKNVFAMLDHSIKTVFVLVALQDVYLAQAQLPALDVLLQLLLKEMDHAAAPLVSISKLPPLDSVSNALNIVHPAQLPMPAKLVLLTSLLSMEPVLAQAEDSSVMVNAFLVSLAAKHAQVLLHATSAMPLFFSKPTLVLLDVDLDTINLDLLAMPALMDVLLALDLTSVPSVNPESLPTMDSVM